MSTTTSHRPPPRSLDLDITIISAKHLKNVNWRNGDLNPYVIFWLDPDHRHATKSDDSNSTKPVWNERFLIPLPSASAAAVLTLEIFHSKPSDTPKPFVGAVRVPIADLPNPKLEESTIVRTFDIRRPSGRPNGKIRLKLALRERRLPDYQNTPQPAYYYATAPHYSYGRFPPSPYNTSPPLPPPPPPPAAPSPPPPPPPSHTYHYGSYSDPYSGNTGYYQNNYYSQPAAPQTPRPPLIDRPTTYGGPSAPVDNGQYEQKLKLGTAASGLGLGLGVGTLSGGLAGLAIDEGLSYEEKPVGRAESEFNDYSDYRRRMDY